MSVDDERVVRQRLERAFSAITADPVPVGQAILQGRKIRARRRMAAAAGLAAVAAAAVAVPLTLHGRSPQQATTRPKHNHHVVTVHPAGPHAAAGLIAWGSIDGRRWTVRITKPGTGPRGRDSQCVFAIGGQTCGPAVLSRGSDPTRLDGFSEGTTGVYFGPVAPDVAYLKVNLTGGTVLTLHPVRVYGVRVVAFVAPDAVIGPVTAYARDRVLATAFPLRPGGTDFGTWIPVGSAGLPRATRVIGSGRVDGASWSVIVYQGPWGRCLVTSAGSNCISSRVARLGTAIIGYDTTPRTVVYGSASPAVTHVLVTLSSGMTIRVRVAAVANQKYFAFAVGKGARPLRWSAYDSARHRVASGPVR